MVFQQKLLEKVYLIYKNNNDWSGHGLAGQFWLLESTLTVDVAEIRFKLRQTLMLTWWQAATF